MAPGYCRCIWQQWCEDNNKDCFDCWHSWEAEQRDSSRMQELENKCGEINAMQCEINARNAEVAAAAEKKAAKKKKESCKESC